MNSIITNKVNYLWIDAAKGIGVFLVIIGHLWYGSNLPIINQIIYSFHMPMFFILSGFVIRRKNREKLNIYFKKKFWRLLVPAFLCIIITIPAYIYYSEDFIWNEAIRKIFYIDGLMAYNDPCWFFIVLFEISLLERIINITEKPIIIKILLYIVFLFGGYLIYEKEIYMPFGFDRAFITMSFLILGILFRDLYERCTKLRKNEVELYWIIVIACMIIWLLFGGILNEKVSLYGMDLNHYWFFIISGISGSIFYFMVCAKISYKVKWLKKVSDNTIFIICTHYVLVSIFRDIMDILGIQYTGWYGILAIIYTIVMVICYIPVCSIIDKKIPAFSGKVKYK